MFKQFTENLSGSQVYLISSLGIFVVFFVVVTVILFRLKRQHVSYMSDLPLEDNAIESPKSFEL
jgi:hypothetical protein